MKEDKELLKALTVINPDACDADIYEGTNEVLEAWNTYYSTYDEMVMEENVDDQAWKEENQFLILINESSRKVYGIRDYGRYSLDADDILFQTKFIPIFTHQPEKEEVFVNHVNHIVELLQNENAKMFRSSRKPLFLLRYCGTNGYIAWSLAEAKLVCVYDYKEYRKSFRVSDYGTFDESKIKENTEYNIIPPSRELISELGLELYPDVWQRKMRWDIWEVRKEKIAVDYINEKYKKIYQQGIEIINKGRKANYGLDDDFANLESRVERFEKLSKLGAPNKILEDELEMINDSITNITFKTNAGLADRLFKAIFGEDSEE